ncbi:MAG TPA: hypothetical protein VGA71_11070 [Actinomycetota bacterium]
MNPVRDDRATIACAYCRRSFVPQGRQRYCDTTCRQTVWRRLHATAVVPLVVVAKASTVYERFIQGCAVPRPPGRLTCIRAQWHEA